MTTRTITMTVSTILITLVLTACGGGDGLKGTWGMDMDQMRAEAEKAGATEEQIAQGEEMAAKIKVKITDNTVTVSGPMGQSEPLTYKLKSEQNGVYVLEAKDESDQEVTITCTVKGDKMDYEMKRGTSSTKMKLSRQ